MAQDHAGADSGEPAIVHRDLRIPNVMLTVGEDGRVVAKVADFGLAQQLMGRDQSGIMMSNAGTPQYMAPEILND